LLFLAWQSPKLNLRQFFAALSAPSGQHIPAGFGLHPLHKTVASFSAFYFGLIGSFH